jgi:hypothetical protein
MMPGFLAGPNAERTAGRDRMDPGLDTALPENGPSAQGPHVACAMEVVW